MGLGKDLENFLATKEQKEGKLKHEVKELLLGYANYARSKYKKGEVSDIQQPADWIRSQNGTIEDKAAAEKLGTEFFKTTNLVNFMADGTENKEGPVGGFLKNNSGWVLGGLAAIASFFMGDGLNLTTLLLGAGGFLLGNAFKTEIGDFVGGLFGEKKPAAPGGPAPSVGGPATAPKTEVETSFAKLDSDKSGKVSLDEIATPIEAALKAANKPFDKEGFRGAFENIDTTKDGLDMAEFAKFAEKMKTEASKDKPEVLTAIGLTPSTTPVATPAEAPEQKGR